MRRIGKARAPRSPPISTGGPIWRSAQAGDLIAQENRLMVEAPFFTFRR
jgi:hypothetical protein